MLQLLKYFFEGNKKCMDAAYYSTLTFFCTFLLLMCTLDLHLEKSKLYLDLVIFCVQFLKEPKLKKCENIFPIYENNFISTI